MASWEWTSRRLGERQREGGEGDVEGRLGGERAAAENGKEGEEETEEGDRREHGRADMPVGQRETWI